MSAIPDAAALSALPPQSKPYRITIGHGLYLEVTPQGSKLWRIKYRFAGKENKLSLGAFPSVTLEQACRARDDARALIKAGVDPSAKRKAERAERITQRARANAFRLVMALDGALTIETPRQMLRLTPDQTAAVRAFLAATPEGSNHAAD
ncbi:Arm DNA-binding domain-containing protein [Pseudomonas aeruginosa]|uniref:Arm DNA-binding domain-containing protein n=2 Tax=Pseudomonas aeruginosa TaxID=287 RepID=UPI00087793DD|nr:Arm DNA-binding domain-containing protein [Pseudomonas aeruginosa]